MEELIKDKRQTLFEDDNCCLEKRRNRYYLAFYDNNGNYTHEITVVMKNNGKVSISQN